MQKWVFKENKYGTNTLSFDCNNSHSGPALCFLSIISSRQVSITNYSGNQRKTKRIREENRRQVINMWWLGLGILFFIWFIMNGDEFYYEGDIDYFYQSETFKKLAL